MTAIRQKHRLQPAVHHLYDNLVEPQQHRKADQVRSIVEEIEFSSSLLEGMLGLLLFAGALHVKMSDLKREWVLVALMATLGVGLSTAVIGVGFSWLTGMPLIVALVFGCLPRPPIRWPCWGCCARPS